MSKRTRWAVTVEFYTEPEPPSDPRSLLQLPRLRWTKGRIRRLFWYMLDELERRHGALDSNVMQVKSSRVGSSGSRSRRGAAKA